MLKSNIGTVAARSLHQSRGVTCAWRNAPAPMSQKAAVRGVQLGHREVARRQREPAAAMVPVTAAAAAADGNSGRPIKPYYNKFRTRADIERSYLRQWQEVTARGDSGQIDERTLPDHSLLRLRSLQERMTVFSALAYVPVWIKFTLVPDFARFLWWLVWERLRAVYHAFHCRAVLQGAKLDAWLAQRAGQPPQFSRSLVLRRYHYRVPVWETLRYRWRLLRGRTAASSHADAAEAQPAPQGA